MNATRLSPADRAALHQEALRRSAELRSEAIVRAWNALFGLVRRWGRRKTRTALA